MKEKENNTKAKVCIARANLPNFKSIVVPKYLRSTHCILFYLGVLNFFPYSYRGFESDPLILTP